MQKAGSYEAKLTETSQRLQGVFDEIDAKDRAIHANQDSVEKTSEKLHDTLTKVLF